MRPLPFWSHRVIHRSAELFGLERSDITGPRRFARLTHPRFLACRAMHLVGMNYTEIGRRMGGRDHGSIMHACWRADYLIERHPHYRMAYEEIVNAAVPGFFPTEEEAA